MRLFGGTGLARHERREWRALAAPVGDNGMRVSELMSRDVVTIKGSATCHDAAARMHEARIRHLPVIDEAGRLEGIVTDRDLRHRLFTPEVLCSVGAVPVGDTLRAVKVREVMSTPPVTVEASARLEDAAGIMRERKIGSVPVVERGCLVGIVTETDLLRRIVQADACCSDVESIVVSFP